MQQPSPSEETSALLARLAQRPGVQSTLILSRESGAIVRSSGLLTSEDAAPAPNTSTSNAVTENAGSPQQTKALLQPNGERKARTGTRQAEEVARIVWKFTQGCSEVIEELNGESDEVKLLRLRTKRNELVVVPDSKFLLVVVHETPPA
ncbi:hypothetical protein K431DRAFT_284106 [Polychaeton citri CBS 116435]|uniref:Roadblock/LAMTOR2 domain-containing protein n=1 Tax=Polychaeton citri CBS 116435 TaxID=1314669 RepID=A0A9P4URK8_9PEZI|nr:hypothetical protein K431DRAFT_284106 [Polychaeton citri CBS 116435]